MKILTFFLLAAAAVFALASCDNNPTTPPSPTPSPTPILTPDATPFSSTP